MKCYVCVLHYTGPLPATVNIDQLNDAVFIINGQSVCHLPDHIDAVIGEPKASNVTITRQQPLSAERAEQLKVTR